MTLSAFMVALIVGGGSAALVALLLPHRLRLTHTQARLDTLIGSGPGEGNAVNASYDFDTFEAEFQAHLWLSKLGWLGLRPEPGREVAQLRVVRWSAALVLVLLGIITQLPPLLWPVLAGIGYWLPGLLAASAWSKLRLSVDSALLTLIGDLSSLVHFTTDPVEILQKAALNQAATGQTFLATELQRTANAVKLQGQCAWEAAEQRAYALKPTLAMVYFILRRLKQTGGVEFAKAFQLTADNLTELISTRQLIQAKAKSANSSMYTIAGIFALIILQMLWNPLLREAYLSPLGQLILALCLGMMAFGFWYILRKIERELT